jgi:hypothetical protein
MSTATCEPEVQEHAAGHSGSMQLVSFKLGGETFGIEITKIREIILIGEITHIPGNRSRGTVPMFAAGRAGGSWKHSFRREHGTVPFGPGGQVHFSPLCRWRREKPNGPKK